MSAVNQQPMQGRNLPAAPAAAQQHQLAQVVSCLTCKACTLALLGTIGCILLKAGLLLLFVDGTIGT